MKFKVLFLTLLLTVGIGFQNCGTCPDVDLFFDIIGMNLVHRGQDNGPLEEDTIAFDDYGSLAIVYDVDFVYNASPLDGFSLMPTAYGLDCLVEGGEGSRDEQYDNITVITLNDYDHLHKANDTINDLITIAAFGQAMDIETFLARNNGNIINRELDLELTSPPSVSSEFQVRVRVDLSTGEGYDAISSPIRFN